MRWLERWAAGCFQRGWSVLALVFVITGLLGGYGFVHFGLNSDMDRVITPRAADTWYYEDDRLKRAFPQFRQTVLVVLSGSTAADVSRATDELLARVPDDGLIDLVTVPNREPLFESSWAYYAEQDAFDQLIQAALALGETGKQLQSTGAVAGLLQGVSLARLSNDKQTVNALTELLQEARDGTTFDESLPVLLQSLTGADGRFYELAVVSATPNFDEQLPAARIVGLIEEWIRDIAPAHPNVDFGLTGDLVLANEEISDALSGVKLAGTLSVIFLILVVTFGVRCWRLTLSLLLLIFVGSIWTHSLAMGVVGTYNTLSLAFIVMFFGLGVDFGLHYGLAVGESPDDAAAIQSAVRKTGSALALSALSTALAFLSFTPTEYTGLGELGIISALGMLVAFFLTLTLLPAIFGVVGLPKPTKAVAPLGGWTLPSPKALPSPKIVIGCWLILAGVGMLPARHANFDYSVAGMRNLQSPGMQVLEQLQQAELMTDYSISSLVSEPDMASITEALKASPSVAYVASVDDYLPARSSTEVRREALLAAVRDLLDLWVFPTVNKADLEQTVGGIFQAAQASNALSDLIFVSRLGPTELARLEAHVQGLLNERRHWFSEAFTAPVPSRDALSQSTRSNWMYNDQFRLEIGPAFSTSSRDNIEQFVSEVRSIVPNAGGRSVIEFGVGSVVVRAFQQATLIACLGIVLILAVYYRGIWMPGVILSSLLITTILTFAVMELLGLSLNMANVLVVPLILGLGIDSAIHVAHRYSMLGDGQAFIHSSTPRAVFLSAITTVATFASLMSSSHQGAASLGQLLAIAIPIMVIVTFTLIPSLLELSPMGSRRRLTAH